MCAVCVGVCVLCVGVCGCVSVSVCVLFVCVVCVSSKFPGEGVIITGWSTNQDLTSDGGWPT
jgi:hypothetical protein